MTPAAAFRLGAITTYADALESGGNPGKVRWSRHCPAKKYGRQRSANDASSPESSLDGDRTKVRVFRCVRPSRRTARLPSGILNGPDDRPVWPQGLSPRCFCEPSVQQRDCSAISNANFEICYKWPAMSGWARTTNEYQRAIHIFSSASKPSPPRGCARKNIPVVRRVCRQSNRPCCRYKTLRHRLLSKAAAPKRNNMTISSVVGKEPLLAGEAPNQNGRQRSREQSLLQADREKRSPLFSKMTREPGISGAHSPATAGFGPVGPAAPVQPGVRVRLGISPPQLHKASVVARHAGTSLPGEVAGRSGPQRIRAPAPSGANSVSAAGGRRLARSTRLWRQDHQPFGTGLGLRAEAASRTTTTSTAGGDFHSIADA